MLSSSPCLSARLLPSRGILPSRHVSPVSCSASNPLGVHALVWTGGWSKEECTNAIKGSKLAGYDLVEVPLLEPATIDAAMTKRILEEYGMQASSSLGLRFDADVSSESSDTVQMGKELLRQALQATAGFGGQYMCGILYSALGKYPQPCSAQSWNNSTTAIKEIAREAGDLGVTLCLEVVNRYETNVLNTAAQAMEFIADVDEANVLVHLDSYHMHIEENSMAAAVATCGDKLGYVHTGECHRGYLGSGSVQWQELFRALAEGNYTGPITFESFSSRVVSPALSNNLCVWRDLWDDSSDLAVHAREFMQAQIQAAAAATGK